MDNADVRSIERLMVDFKDEIKEEFRHQLGIQSEAFQCKLDLVVEGHQLLSEKLDRVEERLDGRIDCVVRKLDTVAAQGNATAAKLDDVVRKLDTVAAQGNTTAAKLDDVVRELDTVAAQGNTTAAKLDDVVRKLDVISADLTAHRRDTEAHPSLYKVKED